MFAGLCLRKDAKKWINRQKWHTSPKVDESSGEKWKNRKIDFCYLAYSRKPETSRECEFHYPYLHSNTGTQPAERDTGAAYSYEYDDG